MHKIFKYPIEIIDTQTIKMPASAKILTAMVQFDKICIWAKIDTADYNAGYFMNKRIYVIGTGNPMPDKEMEYINSVSLMDERLIFHIFEGI